MCKLLYRFSYPLDSDNSEDRKVPQKKPAAKAAAPAKVATPKAAAVPKGGKNKEANLLDLDMDLGSKAHVVFRVNK